MPAAARDCLKKAESIPSNERKIRTPLHPEGTQASVRQYAEAVFYKEELSGSGDYDLLTYTKYLFTVQHWSDFKEIYCFSKEMLDVLSEGTDGTMEIPAEALDLLPFPCLYIETDGQPENGFFADLFDSVSGTKVLRICFLKDYAGEIDYRFFEFDLGAKNFSIRDSVSAQHEITRASLKNLGYDPDILTDFPTEKLALAFSLLVYICCSNAELKESPETASLHQKERTKDQIASTSFRSVRKWIAGEEITRRIKAYNNKKPSRVPVTASTEKAGSPKRPHIRSAHFHHFWTGPRDGERKLIVKWLQPTFINGDSDDIAVKRTEIDL